MGRRKKGNKNPKSIHLPTPTKNAKHVKNPEGYQSQFIAWHFQCMDNAGRWPCDTNTIQKIRNRLHEYEKRRWFEILEQKSNHPMPIDRIIAKAQRRLAELGYDDAPNLYQLEIKNGGGKQRLWGLRVENIFQILWWDPKHEIYAIL